MEWPKRARTAAWESGVLTLDGEKQFEIPELTMNLIERLAGYTLVGFHVKDYPVSDELLAAFAGHKSMVNFGVENAALTDACFPIFSAMPKLRYLLLDGNAAIHGSGLSALQNCKLDLLTLNRTGLPPSPSSPTSRSTIPQLPMMVCWPSPGTAGSSRWPMSNSPRRRWNTSSISSGRRPKSPLCWTSRRRRNAAGCCPLSLPR